MFCRDTKHIDINIILGACWPADCSTKELNSITKWINEFLSPALPSAWKSCSETVFLSFACWFFFLSFFPPTSFPPRDFGEDVFVLVVWVKAEHLNYNYIDKNKKLTLNANEFVSIFMLEKGYSAVWDYYNSDVYSMFWLHTQSLDL